MEFGKCTKDFAVFPASRHFPYSKDLAVFPVSRHFPYSKDFASFAVSRHFPYSKDFSVLLRCKARREKCTRDKCTRLCRPEPSCLKIGASI